MPRGGGLAETPPMTTAESSSSSAELLLFQVADDAVTGDASQEVTEAFAADLQGLRHFARRIGACLDLGEPWHAGFREEDYTLLWACQTEGTGDADPISGGTIESRVPYFEVIEHLTSAES